MRIERVPEHVLEVLHRTDRRLSAPQIGPVERYLSVYYAMSALVSHMDSYYVGTCIPQDRVVDMRYAIERDQVLSGDRVPYGPDGLTARLLKTGRPYLFSEDQGALLRRGLRFGNREEASQDALVVPMAWQGSVEGMIGFLSYTPDTFTEIHLWAAQWLADACIASAKGEQRHIRSSLDLDRIYARNPGRVSSAYDQLLAIEADLVNILDTDAEPDHAAVAAVLRKVQVLRTAQVHAVSPAEALTEREAEVLELVLRRKASNQEIADQLGVTVRTVKAHMSSILRKHGVARRTDLLKSIDA